MNFTPSKSKEIIDSALTKFKALYPDAPKFSLTFISGLATHMKYRITENSYELKFGLELLQWFWENGLNCRPKRAARPSANAEEAVHLTTLHELAHLLQREHFKTKYDKPHSRTFYFYLRELESRIPFEPTTFHPKIALAKQQLAQMLASTT